MSFILDALKKSEAERLQKDAPGIANIAGSGRQKSSSKWIWLVLALITVNLVVLAGLMFKVRQETSPSEPQATATIQQAEPVPAEVAAVVTAATQAEVTPVADAVPEALVDESPIDSPTPIDATASSQFGTVDSGLASFNDLRANGTLNLPDMHLDIHVYSGNSADRFVFVNMSKYKENATLSEGPVVSEITPDGVILNYQGTSFLLPRE